MSMVLLPIPKCTHGLAFGMTVPAGRQSVSTPRWKCPVLARTASGAISPGGTAAIVNMSLAKTMWTGLFTLAPFFGSEKNTLPPPGADCDSGVLPPQAAAATIAAVRTRPPNTRKAIATPFERIRTGNYRSGTRSVGGTGWWWVVGGSWLFRFRGSGFGARSEVERHVEAHETRRIGIR